MSLIKGTFLEKSGVLKSEEVSSLVSEGDTCGMDDSVLSIDGEAFRVSERRQPTGMVSFDFAWLNGPDSGTYGVMVGLSAGEYSEAGGRALGQRYGQLCGRVP